MIMTSFLMWPRRSLMRGNRCTRVSVRAWRNWRRRTHDDIDDPGTLGDRTDDLVVDLAWHAHHHSTHTHTSLTYVIAIYLNTYLSTRRVTFVGARLTRRVTVTLYICRAARVCRVSFTSTTTRSIPPQLPHHIIQTSKSRMSGCELLC